MNVLLYSPKSSCAQSCAEDTLSSVKKTRIYCPNTKQMFHHLAIFHPWSNHLILPRLIKIMSETKMFIAFMSSYLYGNCIRDVIFLFLTLFLFLNEQTQLNSGISSSALWRLKYRLKRTMQMFFIKFSYFLAMELPLISSMEYKRHICNATVPEQRALRQPCVFCLFSLSSGTVQPCWGQRSQPGFALPYPKPALASAPCPTSSAQKKIQNPQVQQWELTPSICLKSTHNLCILRKNYG